MSESFKIILPAAKIPVRSTVTKQTGTKRYTLLDRITVWPINPTGSKVEKEAADPDAKPQVIEATGGTRFLMSGEGSVQVIPGDLELKWYASRQTFLWWLQDRGSRSSREE